MTKVNPPKQKNITMPLNKWLRYVLGSFPRADISPEDAELISLIDSDEQFCHIELPNKENCLRIPRVWYINEWKSCYTRYCAEKQKSEERRKAWCIHKENTARIQRALCIKLGLEPEVVLGIATRIAAKRDVSKCTYLGVTLDMGES